jgi:hypothetical protein
MKGEKEIDIFLVILTTVLLFGIVIGAKMLDHQEAMQQKTEQRSNS